MKKIAVPIDEAGTLDAHFGHCKFFSILTVEGDKVVSEDKIVPPPHEPGLLPRWLAEKEVTDVIAGGMGQKAIQLLNSAGINAYVGAPRSSAKSLTELHLKGTLSLTANYCDHGPDHTCNH